MSNHLESTTFAADKYIVRKLGKDLVKALSEKPQVKIIYEEVSIRRLEEKDYFFNYKILKNNTIEIYNVFGEGRLIQILDILKEFKYKKTDLEIVEIKNGKHPLSKLNFATNENYIITFDPEIVDRILNKHQIKASGQNKYNYQQYSYNGIKFNVFDLSYYYGKGIIPLLEKLRGFEPNTVLFFGNCGAIGKNLLPGDLLIPRWESGNRGKCALPNYFQVDLLQAGLKNIALYECLLKTVQGVFSNTYKLLTELQKEKTRVAVDLENEFVIETFKKTNTRVYSVLEVSDLINDHKGQDIADPMKIKKSSKREANLTFILEYYLRELQAIKTIKDAYEIPGNVLRSPIVYNQESLTLILDSLNLKRRMIVGLGGFAGSGKTNYLSPLINNIFKTAGVKTLVLEADRFVIPKALRIESMKFPKGFYNAKELLLGIKNFLTKKPLHVPLFDPFKHATPKLDTTIPATRYKGGSVPKFIEINGTDYLNKLKSDKDGTLAFKGNSGEVYEKVNTSDRQVLLVDLAYLNNIPEVSGLIDLSIFCFASPEARKYFLLKSKAANQRFQDVNYLQVIEKLDYWKKNHDKHIAKFIQSYDYIYYNE